MLKKESTGNPVVDAILNDEVVNANDLTSQDLEVIRRHWRWMRSYVGSDSTTFDKLDQFLRVYGMLKD